MSMTANASDLSVLLLNSQYFTMNGTKHWPFMYFMGNVHLQQEIEWNKEPLGLFFKNDISAIVIHSSKVVLASHCVYLF